MATKKRRATITAVGPSEQDKYTSIRITPEVASYLKLVATHDGRSIREVIDEIALEYIEKWERKNGMRITLKRPKPSHD